MTYNISVIEREKNSVKKGNLFIEIDKITPCLEDEFGKSLDTVIYKVEDARILKGFTKKSGWYANWSKLYKEYDIFALVLKDNPLVIQGLVALQNVKEAQVVLLNWAVAAPHNNLQLCNKKKYYGVGGHLFAIALHESIKNEYGGVVIGHPSSKKLYEHYQSELHAKPFNGGFFGKNYQYTIVLEGEDARYVYEKYNFEVKKDDET